MSLLIAPSFFPVSVAAKQPVSADSPQVASTDSQRTIHYLVYGDAGEPYQILDDPEQGPGLITEVVHEIFRNSGYRLQTVIKPLRRVKREMRYGQVTHWVAYGLRSWQQEDVWGQTRFADVDIVDYELSLGYRKRSEPFSFDELQGRQVVWLQGYRYPGAQEFADRHGFEFLRGKNHASVLKMVAAGRAPYFMEQADRMRYVMGKLGMDPSEYQMVPLGGEVPPTQVTLQMSNDLGPELHEFVNRRLQQLVDSGWLAKAAARYGLNAASAAPVLRDQSRDAISVPAR